MIELYNVTDYGRYSYNREAESGRNNQAIDFGELMTGSDEMSGNSDDVPAYSNRTVDFNIGTFIDLVTYTHGGVKLMLSSNLGSTIDIIV